ncbi:glycoside hydrolase family 5 protein [Mycena crocata]|nr:glycoside hydrolase family 5 protein [Mycena crocata]
MSYQREQGAFPSTPASPYSDNPQPQPAYAHEGLNTPSASQPDLYHDDPDGAGYPPASPNNSVGLLPTSPSAPRGGSYGAAPIGSPSAKKRRRGLIGFGAVAALIIVVVAVVVPVYFLVIKKNNDTAAAESVSDAPSSSGSSTGGSSSTGGGGTVIVGAVTGGDGSTVVTANGESFTYKNPYGGYWLADAADPFATGARPNNWTPPLNESWTWGRDHVYGVNLGGWFVLEPFISPALFQAYPAAQDEWTLSTLMRADGDGTLEKKLEEHYATFITEEDIAQIAGAGLNWVRVPIPFWAISTWSDVGSDGTAAVKEPFLEGVCWKYIVRLFGWARKYGIRVNLDLHTVPGSQNGYNHSGKGGAGGQVNFLNGVMGVANAQRALDYIRIIAEFIAQPEYAEVVQMFGIVNEAHLTTIGRPQLTSFYLQAHNMIREITGFGEGKGPYMSIHDGFDGVASWAGFLTGSDRIILDTHPYFAFNQQPNTEPIATGEDAANAGGIWPGKACKAWASSYNVSRTAFGVTVAGEFSNGYNDCGLYLTGVNGSTHYGGDCSFWEDASKWDASTKAGVREFALASMDAMQDWFFWTWKIGKAADGVVRSPLWSYQLGLEGGWLPADPRVARGKCASLGVDDTHFVGTYSAWQTGGAGAGTIAPDAIASFGTWPPKSLSHVDAAALTVMPTYTATGSVATLTYVTPSATGTATVEVTQTATAGNGWFNKDDKAPGVTAVVGCTYPNAWGALTLQAPVALCTGA